MSKGLSLNIDVFKFEENAIKKVIATNRNIKGHDGPYIAHLIMKAQSHFFQDIWTVTVSPRVLNRFCFHI
jgi:hypothetical protein